MKRALNFWFMLLIFALQLSLASSTRLEAFEGAKVPDSPYQGPSDAPVEIKVFSDFQ